MNPYTGELRELRRGDDLADGLEELPDALQKIAMRKLSAAALTERAEPQTAQVNLMSRSPLAVWAKKKRKAKVAAASRRRNRK